MKKALGLSLVVSTLLMAESGVLNPILVEGETFKKEVQHINA